MFFISFFLSYSVSTHSRAEAAAKRLKTKADPILVSTHSRAEAAADQMAGLVLERLFQHTAARRRLLDVRQKPP